MKLLAFETATEACSVAVYVDGEIRERHAIAPRQHTALALPWADELLADAGIGKSQLDAIAVLDATTLAENYTGYFPLTWEY